MLVISDSFHVRNTGGGKVAIQVVKSTESNMGEAESGAGCFAFPTPA